MGPARCVDEDMHIDENQVPADFPARDPLMTRRCLLQSGSVSRLSRASHSWKNAMTSSGETKGLACCRLCGRSRATSRQVSSSRIFTHTNSSPGTFHTASFAKPDLDDAGDTSVYARCYTNSGSESRSRRTTAINSVTFSSLKSLTSKPWAMAFRYLLILAR